MKLPHSRRIPGFEVALRVLHPSKRRRSVHRSKWRAPEGVNNGIRNGIAVRQVAKPIVGHQMRFCKPVQHGVSDAIPVHRPVGDVAHESMEMTLSANGEWGIGTGSGAWAELAGTSATNNGVGNYNPPTTTIVE